MRVALVEDDTHIAQLMGLWLEEAGYSHCAYGTGQDFLRDLARESYDLIILDWMLPDTDGDQVLASLRERAGWRVPVIFVTARDAEADIVRGLELGADDYITKPVRPAELLARIQAVMRRSQPADPAGAAVLDVPPYRVDSSTRTVLLAGQPVDLTHMEFELTQFLFRNVDRVLSRGHILESVWGKSAGLNTRTVDTHISRLRTKLGLGAEHGLRLTAVYNHGYRLERVVPTAAAG